MEIKTVFNELESNSYPGRGIIVGKSADGKKAVVAYFIMGRSENSRNRIFVADGEGLRTQAFDESKMKDPSLIIYHPVRVIDDGGKLITVVTNGDQTDTVFGGLKTGLTFEESLRCRCYEPDAPNFTPRISSVLNVADGKFDFSLSILKSDVSALAKCGDNSCSCSADKTPPCNRYTFSYENQVAGTARFIHTYDGDGNPLPSFSGEPTLVDLGDDSNSIEKFSESLWQSLNAENKVSLFVRFIDVATGKYETKIINKLQ